MTSLVAIERGWAGGLVPRFRSLFEGSPEGEGRAAEEQSGHADAGPRWPQPVPEATAGTPEALRATSTASEPPPRTVSARHKVVTVEHQPTADGHPERHGLQPEPTLTDRSGRASLTMPPTSDVPRREPNIAATELLRAVAVAYHPEPQVDPERRGLRPAVGPASADTTRSTLGSAAGPVAADAPLAGPRADQRPFPALSDRRDQPLPESGPVVHVTIGRLEIRAIPETTPARPQRSERRTESLDEYLARRNRGAVP